jgi:hypothetical membrane protein
MAMMATMVIMVMVMLVMVMLFITNKAFRSIQSNELIIIPAIDVLLLVSVAADNDA